MNLKISMISEVFTFPNSCIIKFEAKYGLQILNFILCVKVRLYFHGHKNFLSCTQLLERAHLKSNFDAFCLRKILTA